MLVTRWKAKLSLSDDSITGCGRGSNSPCYERAVREKGEEEEEQGVSVCSWSNEGPYASCLTWRWRIVRRNCCVMSSFGAVEGGCGVALPGVMPILVRGLVTSNAYRHSA
jgi:hypothetical protein